MNTLPREMLQIIAFFDVKVYHVMILLCKYIYEIVNDKYAAMDMFAVEKINDESRYIRQTHRWTLPNGTLHRGFDLPAVMQITYRSRAAVDELTHIWYTNGVNCRYSSDADHITLKFAGGELRLIKKWYVSNMLVNGRPGISIFTERQSYGVVDKQEMFKRNSILYEATDAIGWNINDELMSMYSPEQVNENAYYDDRGSEYEDDMDDADDTDDADEYMEDDDEDDDDEENEDDEEM